ncbi:TrkH family potassium uptake protein, partial [Paracoccus aestuarii]
MMDLRPVAHPIGKILTVIGAFMLFPMAVDWWNGDPHWVVFLQSAALTMIAGTLVAVATAGRYDHLTLHQAFLLTSGIWLILPLFGTLPLMLGASDANFTDAFFESMSGFTTTGTTALPQLDGLARGIHLWRAILQ